jgi:hypothetical protein
MRWIALGVPAIVLSLSASAVRADFALDSQSLSIDPATHVADFTLTFNQKPDFSTVDSLGRPDNSFQVEFNGNYQPPLLSPVYPLDAQSTEPTSIIRGDEIHIADSIPVRLPDGNGGPNSGGWGPAITSVPFSLIGDTLSFSVPAADLGWTGHYYQYTVSTLLDGSQTASQLVTAIPTPKALTSGLAGLALVGTLSHLIRKRSAKRLG